jgi:hypothetical protein
MGFDFSSFFGGFAEGAAVQVEKKNKEIRESTTNELERLYRSAEKNKEQAMTKREELKAMASELATYKGMGGVGLDDNQILGLLQTGSAKTVLSELRSKKDQLSTVDLTSIVKVPKAEGPIDLGGELTKMTTLPKGEPLPAGTDRSTRTAFGLPTNVAAQTEDRFGKIAGMSTQDLRAAAAGMPEAPLRKDVELDLSVFKDPEGVAVTSARLAENLANDIPLNDPKNAKLVKKLEAFDLIKGAVEKENRTAAAIGSVFDKSIRNALAPLSIGAGAIVKWSETAGSYESTVGTPEAMNRVYDAKNKVVREKAMSMGILDEDGNIKGGQPSRDALEPFANIRGNKVVSWIRLDEKGNSNKEDKKSEAAKDAEAIDNAPAAKPAAKPEVKVEKAAPKEYEGRPLVGYAKDKNGNTDFSRPLYKGPNDKTPLELKL